MPRTPQTDWVTIALPREIVERIDSVIKTRKYGFRSRTDVVLEAVKWKLEQLNAYP